MKVYIDPRVEYRYSSFYRLGLERIVQKENIIYTTNPFIDLECKTIEQFKSGLQFIVEENNDRRKIYIDVKDIAEVEEDKYNWADIYAKVNVKFGDLGKYDKLVVLGPGFGIRGKSLIELCVLGLMNFFRGRKTSSIQFKYLCQTYIYPYIRRRGIAVYEYESDVKDNYIFHASTLWYNKFATTDTNKYRGDFLKACKKAGLEIEGGLFYVDSPAVLEEMPDYPRYLTEYKDFIYKERLSMDDYIRKTKESVLVFNTPSVCECHGWKLAEYLCMGKAIISTPLTREMPEDMMHGENIHFVNSPEEIYDAVVKINVDSKYREKLEKGARAYYEKWLAPEVVMKRIIKAAFELDK